MTTHKVVIQSRLPGRLVEILAGLSIVRPDPEPAFEDARLFDELKDAEALLSRLTFPVDAALFARAPKLRIVANHAVGLDNIDLAAAKERGITITHTPGVLTSACADLSMALLLACARRLGEAGMLARSGKWTGFEPEQMLGLELEGATLGIVGFGRIGRAVATRARAFGMRILGCGRSQIRSYAKCILERRTLSSLKF